MMNTNTKMRERRVAFADGGYAEPVREKRGNKKLSAIMAMFIGLIITLEIMVAAAMMFRVDVRAVDGLAVIFTFAVVYFGVVAGLTDR